MTNDQPVPEAVQLTRGIPDEAHAKPDSADDPDRIVDPDDPVDRARMEPAPTQALRIYEIRTFTTEGYPVDITGYQDTQTNMMDTLVGSATFTGQYGVAKKKQTVAAPAELFLDCDSLDEAFGRLIKWYEQSRFAQESALAGMAKAEAEFLATAENEMRRRGRFGG